MSTLTLSGREWKGECHTFVFRPMKFATERASLVATWSLGGSNYAVRTMEGGCRDPSIILKETWITVYS